MNFSITGQEKCDLLIQVTVTAWAGLTVHAPVINLTYTVIVLFDFYWCWISDVDT